MISVPSPSNLSVGTGLIHDSGPADSFCSRAQQEVRHASTDGGYRTHIFFHSIYPDGLLRSARAD